MIKASDKVFQAVRVKKIMCFISVLQSNDKVWIVKIYF